jgi:ELAV like protein 2/3/4
MTQAELESLFADFGSIISSKILCNPKAGRLHISLSLFLFRLPKLNKIFTPSIHLGASKSVGFIRYDQRSEAEMAINTLNGTIPKGRSSFEKRKITQSIISSRFY